MNLQRKHSGSTILNCLIGLFFWLMVQTDITTEAQALSKRSSRITSSRTSFGTQVKNPSILLSSSRGGSDDGSVTFNCPEEFGYFPHPTDCTQYFVCVFGGALLESCTGGLMYSHELQTCDWPRNVGCEQQQQQQQQQQQSHTNVPSRVRFGAAFTTVQQHVDQEQQQQQQQIRQPLKPTVPPQYHRQPSQVIQAQVHNVPAPPPPPPELKVPPNPVITSRGQPKHILEAQAEIAKLYADALETLPPVEEEETDRQQRVYRGQPSTVSQVQRDRDGIIHQPNINVIPNHDKFNSYNSYGGQYRDLDYQPQSKQQHQPQHKQQLQQQLQQPQQHYQSTPQPIRNTSPIQQQQSTYRPLDIFTSPQPASIREPHKSQTKSERPLYNNNNSNNNQQSLIYNTDYDEDLIAQIEQDNAYDQPTRTASRSKVHVNKKLRQQQQQSRLPAINASSIQQQQTYSNKSLKQQQQSPEKETQFRQLKTLTTPTTTPSTALTPSMKTTTTIQDFHLLNTDTTKRTSYNQSTLNQTHNHTPYNKENSTLRDKHLFTHESNLYTEQNQLDNNDDENVYDESQNIQIHSSEPPKNYNKKSINGRERTVERMKEFSNNTDKGTLSRPIKQNPIQNYVSGNNDKSQLESKSQNSKVPTDRKRLPIYFASEENEKLLSSLNGSSIEQSDELLSETSSEISTTTIKTTTTTTTLKYPVSTTLIMDNGKHFEYSLQRGINGFTLRVQNFTESPLSSQPIYERTTTSVTTQPTISAKVNSAAKTSGIQLKESSDEIIMEPTTYVPPLRVWRNGRPTYPTITPKSVNEYSHLTIPKFSNIQKVSEEYLPSTTPAMESITTTTVMSTLSSTTALIDEYITPAITSKNEENATLNVQKPMNFPINRKASGDLNKNNDNAGVSSPKSASLSTLKPPGTPDIRSTHYRPQNNISNTFNTSNSIKTTSALGTGTGMGIGSNFGTDTKSSLNFVPPKPISAFVTGSSSFGTTERPILSFTARTALFKDNLQRTTSSTQRYVSPYKSLETLLQDERSALGSSRTTHKPRYLPSATTPLPFLQTTAKLSSNQHFLLMSSPPKNLSQNLLTTTSNGANNFSISDALLNPISLKMEAHINPITVSPTSTSKMMVSTSTESVTGNTNSSLATSISSIANSLPIKLLNATPSETMEKIKSRGRSRYTFATLPTINDNDEPQPTIYSTKFKNNLNPPSDVNNYSSTTTTTQIPSTNSLAVRRKIQRIRIQNLKHQRPTPAATRVKAHERLIDRDFFISAMKKRKSIENESTLEVKEPRIEALSARSPFSQQENSIESTKSSEIHDDLDHVVSITDRPLKYFYSQKYRQNTPERLLAESLENAGYIDMPQPKASRAIYQPSTVLEQLQLFLQGSNSDEDESSSSQFVNDFMEPAIKAAVEELRHLYGVGITTTKTTPTQAPQVSASTRANLPSSDYMNTINGNYSNNTNTAITAPTTRLPIINRNNSYMKFMNNLPTIPKHIPKSQLTTSNTLSSYTDPSNNSITITNTMGKQFHPVNHNNTISYTTNTTITTNTTTATPLITSTSRTTINNSLPPARISRVNNAIKSSIAAAATAPPHKSPPPTTLIRSNKFALVSSIKCSDTTSNAKCNEIPSRINSNSNRNRGGSNYNQDRDVPSSSVTNNRGTYPPRTRPTLKPSGNIVSKAQEFVDIYRYPAIRSPAVYPQPIPDKTAAKCRRDVCLLPDCYCGGRDIPVDMPVEQVPQIVLMTFDDSVNDLNKQLYIDLFEKGRVNPNGCPITATFYVSHEWTDYSQVQNLYADGHEMASHTISHSFGEQFSQKKWTREVAGQREILAAYGGVKLSDVRGMRAPFLSVGGNKMYKMLYDSNFTYDSSLPVYENRPPSWPYTFDYKIFHDCMIPPCPTRSYPGVWEVPMVMWQDLNGGRCSMGDACSNPSDADGVAKMIMKNFERHYTTNRAPFGLFYHAAWFTQPHHKDGFIKFLDTINAMPDVWIVTNWQAIQWVRDPTPLSKINTFQPFQCDYSDRPKRCNNPKVCNLWHKSGVRYMKTCQPCPDIYPWTGKTGIRSSRIDNDIEDST